MSLTVYDIFKELNDIPRPSHHEKKVADYLCKFAKERGLKYDRDTENCVVIRKPATPGHERAETIVLLNHMDMVAVGDGSRPFDPLNDGIEAYIEEEACHEQGRRSFIKAKGTSLGADNGIGLSMALAVLDSNEIEHGPIEVLTTTNEEDGMTGASKLSKHFIKGRKVINLDSEDYDTITVGAAGAYLQIATFFPQWLSSNTQTITDKKLSFFKIELKGGLGGHSGVDINKGRCNAIHELAKVLFRYKFINGFPIWISEINGGDANASIASQCYAIVGIKTDDVRIFYHTIEQAKRTLREKYALTDPNLVLSVEEATQPELIKDDDEFIQMLNALPCGVIRMRDDMPGTVMTSNNIGMVRTFDGKITVSCHTRSFSDDEMVTLAESITDKFKLFGGEVKVVMNTPGWQENQHSDYLQLVDSTFNDVLGFTPRKVAMHFVLEAGYYVQKYPGIEIACIGPRIIEPHSTKERVEISTIDDIWKVLLELLKRLS